MLAVAPPTTALVGAGCSERLSWHEILVDVAAQLGKLRFGEAAPHPGNRVGESERKAVAAHRTPGAHSGCCGRVAAEKRFGARTTAAGTLLPSWPAEQLADSIVGADRSQLGAHHPAEHSVVHTPTISARWLTAGEHGCKMPRTEVARATRQRPRAWPDTDQRCRRRKPYTADACGGVGGSSTSGVLDERTQP